MSSSSPDKVLARKGRHKQRYDNEYRLVAGCVPYRTKDEGNPCSLGNDPGRMEVLMISTPNRTDMVFPKGGWEDDEDVYEAASREAMEEAGVKGIIDLAAWNYGFVLVFNFCNRATLGHWVFKSKSSQKSNSPRGACKGYIFAMEVTEELESWPEQATHGRRWVSPGEAYQLCRYDWMREALTALLERLSMIEAVGSTQERTDQTGMYIMLQTTSDGAVALC